MEAILHSNSTGDFQSVKLHSQRALTAGRLAVSALFFMNGVLFASWVSRIPIVQMERGLNHAQLGLALLMIAFGALMAMPATGWCSSRFGSRRVTQIAAVLFCLTLPLLAFKTPIVLFTLFLFCFGAVHGALDVAMNAQAVAVEIGYRRPIMSSFHALFSAGGLIGAVLGAGFAMAGTSLLAHFFAVTILVAVPLATFAFSRLVEANDAHSAPLSSDDNAKPRSGFAWPPKTLVALGAVAFCVMMGEGAMADWSAVFLSRFAHSSEAVAAGGYAAFSIAMAAGRFSGDRLSSRFGPVTLVRAGSALAAAGLALALLWAQPIPALIGFAAVGAGFATIVPQVFSAAGNTPGIASGAALAMATTIGYTGFLIGPPLIGFVAQAIGLRNALGIVIAMSVLMIFLAPSVRRQTVH